MYRIFTYGTLMRGEANFAVMRDCEFLGTGTTPGSVFGYGFAPGAVSPEHPAHKGGLIHGELFGVSERTKKILDYLEGVKQGNYTLTDVKVEMANGETVDAQIYFHNHYREYGTYHPEKWEPEY